MSDAAAAPHLIIVAGPNGAGKSTSAPHLLRDTLEVSEFVNADSIASGLSAFRPESVAIAAGRIMLARMRHLAAARENFAYETTLAGRTLAPWIVDLKRSGYHVHLLFLWLESAELAVSRVAERVRLGGHNVPADVVRRRYGRGLTNLFGVYLPLADTWQMFDNSRAEGPSPIATGHGLGTDWIANGSLWKRIEETHRGKP